jgi:hypothetical protein
LETSCICCRWASKSWTFTSTIAMN